MIPAATGKTTPIRLLSSRLTPRLAASRKAHQRGRGFLLVDGAQEGPHRERDAGGQHHVGNLDAGEQKQADAGGDTQARVKSGTPPEGPHSERGGEPGETDG